MAKTGATAQARRRPGIWILMMLTFILELLAYTWCRVQWTRASYDLESAKRAWRQSSQTEQRLQTELASLRMPQRIEAEAAARLGLGRAAPEQITRLP
jgi:hypothetical protein